MKALLLAAAALLAVAVPTSAMEIASDEMASGERFEFTFTEEGTFHYHCHLHPWVEAEVVVGPAGEGPRVHSVTVTDMPPGSGDGFEPSRLTISAGDTVVWTNEGQHRHQVWGDFVAATGGEGLPREESPAGLLVAVVALVGAALISFKNRQRL